MRELKHYINGEWIPGSNNFVWKNPSDNSDLHAVPNGTSKDIRLALQAAREAFGPWAKLGVEKRSHFVHAMATWLREQYGSEMEKTDIKSRIMQEVGKPLPEADIEVMECADFLDYYAGIAGQLLSEPTILQLDQNLWATKQSKVVWEPYGIVAIVKPWNYPLEMIAWSLGPALLAGNTIVIKPSEKSSDAGTVFGEISDSIGLPPGVINVILGGDDTGKELVASDDVKYVSFTGSIAAGRSVAVSCANRLVKCTLELGGNDPAIVLSDANLETAANGLVWGAFCNAGQVCVGVKRAYIDKEIYDQLTELIVEKVGNLRVGKEIGPIIDTTELTRVEEMVNDAVTKGAECLIGGERIGNGNYYSPVVLRNVPQNARLMMEECFGPVLPICEFSSIDDAIELANLSEHGLGASIWTTDLEKGEKLADLIQAGMVWINDVNVAFPQAPWGGRKLSGVGYELSRNAIFEYGLPKHISTEGSSDTTRVWWYPY